MYPALHCSHVMASNHTTTEVEQTKTDTFAVFRDLGDPNLRFIGRVEVPRYTQPNTDGVRMGLGKRMSLAVARVVESDESFIENFMDPYVEHDDLSEIEGEEFLVMTDIDGDMEHVAYEQNPAFDGVWDPYEVEA